jgi:quinohemoprotein ethanol dehydrogenase
MAFSPQTGLVYLPAQDVPFYYLSDDRWSHVPGVWNIAVNTLVNAPPSDIAARRAIRASLKGQLIAWDPVAQREVWRAQYDGPWNGGALATAGNLVFQGTAKGEFQAFNAQTGEKLWGFDAQTGIGAGPVSYRVGRDQYVAVMAGYGGAYALAIGVDEDKGRAAPNGRLLVFKLDGKARLPAAQVIPLPPATIVADSFTPEQLAEGGAVFESNCGVCHGAGARSSGILPDLRRSAALADREGWQAIVHQGALAGNGMVSFGRWFSPQQVEAVRGYVAEQAKLLAKEQAMAETGGRAGGK